MKITKKLVTSVICLVLSLAFCVWAVFAWFARNDSVDATGMQVSVDNPDLTMTVNIYHLTSSADASQTTVYTKGAQFGANERFDYVTSGPTAVLIEIKVTNSNPDTPYSDLPLVITTDEYYFRQNNTDEDEYDTSISNGISMHNALTTSNGAPTVETTEFHSSGDGSFIRQTNGTVQENSNGGPQKDLTMSLNHISVAAASETYVYYIMNYDNTLIAYLNSQTTSEGSGGSASVTAQIDFAPDLTFVLGDNSVTGATHIHAWGNWVENRNDDTYHYRTCTNTDCSVSQRQVHTYGGWTIASNGQSQSRTCGVCRHVQTEEITATYTVTLNANGGTFAGGQSTTDITTTGEVVIAELTRPTYANHTFAGWTYEQNSTDYLSGTITVTQNDTLYAQWTESGGDVTTSITYRIYFNNGETVYENLRASDLAGTIDDVIQPNNSRLRFDAESEYLTITLDSISSNSTITVEFTVSSSASSFSVQNGENTNSVTITGNASHSTQFTNTTVNGITLRRGEGNISLSEVTITVTPNVT